MKMVHIKEKGKRAWSHKGQGFVAWLVLWQGLGLVT